MKMAKKMAIYATVFCSTLPIAGNCLPTHVDKEVLSARWEKVYRTLNEMYEGQESVPCAHTIQYSGYVMLGASMQIRSERYAEARNNLKVAEGNLSKTHVQSKECAYFSPKVRPSLDEVRKLIYELGAG